MVDYTFIRKDIIKRQTVIEGILELQSPLRIGVGKSGGMDPASIARDTVLKDTGGTPIIPGSSWKGVFRSEGERILRRKNLIVCSGVGKDYCLNNFRKYDDFQRNLTRDIDEAIRIFWNYTCLNCKLFGSMSVIGAVKFLDSKAIEFKLGTRTMIAISRTEGAVARGALVQVEFVEPGSKFTFKIMGNNLPNYAIGYLLTIMKNIHDGFIQIGGHKSRGFGFIRFVNLRFSDKGEKKIGDEDVSVSTQDEIKEEGDKFFEKMKPFMEAFNNAKIPYPVH
ncbi:CRISPR-associated RAMP protein, SSO1426 family [Sulfolobus islandicus L.S.2.15]|uniref:CRISPR-associated RAMP protein, SSO1426 family n=1 Tax=Saccharolobus islandicus (strain L.S.2.15 / Lassen \|nr:CRISPR-associated RAMP protein Csx7 [Sulfolobus islandicus]ACP34779.1 CRISPR-associated RAMP protein, SSO1426 family [Sulfolobus islandicus L.S.2.15]